MQVCITLLHTRGVEPVMLLLMMHLIARWLLIAAAAATAAAAAHCIPERLKAMPRHHMLNNACDISSSGSCSGLRGRHDCSSRGVCCSSPVQRHGSSRGVRVEGQQGLRHFQVAMRAASAAAQGVTAACHGPKLCHSGWKSRCGTPQLWAWPVGDGGGQGILVRRQARAATTTLWRNERSGVTLPWLLIY